MATEHDEISASDFEARFRRLTTALDAGHNQDCIECHRCSACARSTFCSDSERLVGCHYCVASTNCTDCSHSSHCARLVGCHHCRLSEDCTASSYLVRCTALANCSYCFGCVGLSGKDFHILNEPYERSEYFKVTARLTRELRLERHT
ncbi:MAG: hypothetical protein RJA70_2404 [Pseudomonadota bacterium]|jgi:hypothetical protein